MKTREKQEEPSRDPQVGDFYTIEVRCETYYVTPQTAARVGAVLERFWRPRWLKFVDIYGRRVWVRSVLVESINESTESQRGRDRAFQYARRKEERADRRWDDEEY